MLAFTTLVINKTSRVDDRGPGSFINTTKKETQHTTVGWDDGGKIGKIIY